LNAFFRQILANQQSTNSNTTEYIISGGALSSQYAETDEIIETNTNDDEEGCSAELVRDSHSTASSDYI